VLLFVFIDTLRGEEGEWVVGCELLGLFDLCALGHRRRC
jgi:hypothetical protein